MELHLLETINHTTEFIEDHLLEELSLDRISEQVNISKFHLLRIWKGATATGLMEYVRRRRIALSLGDLIHERNSIEFISSKYSFGCERTYSRVFKEEFNISPAKWRRSPSPLQIMDRFNADFLHRAGEGLVYFHSTSVLPPFSIAGPEYRVDVNDNMANQTSNRLGVAFFYKDRPRIINPVNKDTYIGYTTVPEPFQGYTWYQPSVEVNQSSIIPPDMSLKHVAPHRYGVFTYMGPHRPEEINSKSLSLIWKHIFDTWMPTVQFDLEEKFSFELINYARCNKKYCECNLYYPISKI
ncbi:AraC family transcriptional regulator [Paenibacillus helianthi]|uniref:AraC family transcriptional regulator n=1 Tax=Paenibacillus helianthi TaxID=1349432 RepID=A0ABX3EJT5_9BACL|nr:helix-turn-helix domain-containing protein [Paenibacillus helianthi]OKP81806.1 AraC family transcriptional regulator [Paenibacillus helianthi]